MGKKVKKCPSCGIEILIIEEDHPLKHICTDCGGRGKICGDDPTVSKRRDRLPFREL